MCGIVYKKSFIDKDVTKDVLKIFDNQRTRGTTSFGFYLPELDQMSHEVKEKKIRKAIRRHKGDNHEILFHHRLSTSTVDVRNACHPFSTKNHFKNQYIGVHNGIVWNSNELQRQHSDLGISYVSTQPDGTFNDSEALIYDLARFSEGLTDKITAYGSVAFVMVKRNNRGKAISLLYGRNYGSPLKMWKDDKQLILSSEGLGVDVPTNILYEYNYSTQEITGTPMVISNGYYGYSGNSATTYDDDYDWQPTDSYSGVGEFSMRIGTNKEILDDFLEDAYGDYDYAIKLVNTELGDCKTEIEYMQWAMDTTPIEEDIGELLDYCIELEAYQDNLYDIKNSLMNKRDGVLSNIPLISGV